MSNVKKLMMTAAGGEALNVEDVFSTYLYTGTNAAQTITNGIDLSGEGGLVWMKSRTTATIGDHALFDSETVTGSTFPVVQKAWVSNDAGVLDGYQPGFTFTSTGFTTAGRSDTDQSGVDYVTWSFRKCPKFFDVVSYTGNSTSGRTISHNLGVVPAMIIIMGKSTGDYWVYHKDVGNTKYLELNKNTAEQTSSAAWNNTTPTDSVFTVGNEVPVNYSGQQYTAYLFAHNDGDGDFGPAGDQDIIKCGSYTGSGSAGNAINLGFEPQWVLIKNASRSESWHIWDTMRGIVTDGTDPRLFANTSAAEANNADVLDLNPTGFTIEQGNSFPYNYSGDTYIYIAIRRGPMAVPESATEVFAIDTESSTQPQFTSGFPVDTALRYYTAGGLNWELTSRLTQGKRLIVNQTSGEGSESAYQFDYMDGWEDTISSNSSRYSWMWRRAPNYFDVVCYTGNATAGNTISHNLGVAPEMMWVKRRDTTGSWAVYHTGTDATAPEDKYLKLETADAAADLVGAWNDTAPTATEFTLGNWSQVNNTNNYVAYLFASLDGVSKVGSYTSDGTDGKVIDCGFTSGARFVLVKGASVATNWLLWDSERGIVAGNDPFLELNTTDAEDTGTDYIDPHSSGFIVNSGMNFGTNTFIFYAIA